MGKGKKAKFASIDVYLAVLPCIGQKVEYVPEGDGIIDGPKPKAVLEGYVVGLEIAPTGVLVELDNGDKVEAHYLRSDPQGRPKMKKLRKVFHHFYKSDRASQAEAYALEQSLTAYKFQALHIGDTLRHRLTQGGDYEYRKVVKVEMLERGIVYTFSNGAYSAAQDMNSLCKTANIRSLRKLRKTFFKDQD